MNINRIKLSEIKCLTNKDPKKPLSFGEGWERIMEVLNKDSEKEIGQFVADDFRTAAVFSKYKIDFCCNGNRTINDVCEKKGLDNNVLLDELYSVLNSKTNQSIDYKSWPLDLLADYIEKKHHRYVAEKIPVLRQFLDKLCSVHGDRHPELFKINEYFTASAGELAAHMKNEESIVFPFVKGMVNTKLENGAIQSSEFGTVESPIAKMMLEHDNEGERFRQIAELTNNYNPPADGCNTYQVAFAMLKEFEEDLHLHIHLENNILFPGAIKLEQQFG